MLSPSLLYLSIALQLFLLSVTAMLGLMSAINQRAMGMHPPTLVTAKVIEVKRQGPDLLQFG